MAGACRAGAAPRAPRSISGRSRTGRSRGLDVGAGTRHQPPGGPPAKPPPAEATAADAAADATAGRVPDAS